MPDRLVQRLKAARNFNQGFATVEYMACAYLDMALHDLGDGRGARRSAFERATLERLGMPREIVLRHRIPHFLHIMGGYAAGYYSYLWSEVMDADAFAAFEEAGTSSTRKPRVAWRSTSTRPATAAIRWRPTSPSAAGRRASSLLRKRGFLPA